MAWMDRFLSNTVVNIVVYTDIDLSKYAKSNIRIINRPIEEFYTYKYRDYWVENHDKNVLLNKMVDWKVVMLWCEKQQMVMDSMKYFDTEFYGWVDIGYFRGHEAGDIQVENIKYWGNCNHLSRDKVYYGCVDKYAIYKYGTSPIPHNQSSIAGGCYIGAKDTVIWWRNTFYEELNDFIVSGKLIKDDQYVIITAYYKYSNKFQLVIDNEYNNKWFVFQRYLLTVKVSILMALYNGVEYIDESVMSVISQTYPHWELIIGINGHPSGSSVYHAAMKYASDKIRVIEYPTHGKAATLNAMVGDSVYNYVAILDVDDIWKPEKLEKQIDYIKTYDVVGTQCKYFGDRDDIPAIPIGDLTKFDFLSYNPIVNSSCIIRKEYAKWNDNIVGVEDYDLWLSLRFKCRFYNVDSIEVLHRIHKASAFNNTNHIFVEELKKKHRMRPT
jgi:teichuronic acid biosynthesis glycosyltransferase TuaG